METVQRTSVARTATDLFYEVIERRINLLRRRLAGLFARFFSPERGMDRAARRDLFGTDGDAVSCRSVQDMRFSDLPPVMFLL